MSGYTIFGESTPLYCKLKSQAQTEIIVAIAWRVIVAIGYATVGCRRVPATTPIDTV